MKLILKFTFFLLIAHQTLCFAQKAEDIAALKKITFEHYSNTFGDFGYDNLNKWMLYGLRDKELPMHSEHKSAMVFILNGEDVVVQYYFIYDSDLGYSKNLQCDCCHIERDSYGLVSHCKSSCSTAPFTESRKLVEILPYINKTPGLELIRYK